MDKNIEELTLLLMYLTSWDEDGFREKEDGGIEEAKMKTTWKGYSFNVINDLTDKSYLYYSKHSNKTVTLTPEARSLLKS